MLGAGTRLLAFLILPEHRAGPESLPAPGRGLGLFDQLRQGWGCGHLHGPHDYGALLQELPVLGLPLGDDPLGNVTERALVNHMQGYGGVGQGVNSEHVAREPVGGQGGKRSWRRAAKGF